MGCILLLEHPKGVNSSNKSTANIRTARRLSISDFRCHALFFLEYDRKHSSDLYFTLESFFSNELSYKLTSEKLFIHVNTLHARISKIEHLIHVSFSNLDSIIGLRLTILLNQFDYFSHYRSHPA